MALNLELVIVEDLKEIHTHDRATIPDFKEGDDLAELTRVLQAHQMEIVRVAGNSGSWDGVSTGKAQKDFAATFSYVFKNAPLGASASRSFECKPI